MNLVREAMQAPKLWRVPTAEIRTSVLPRVSAADLSELWAHNEHGRQWREDRARIEAALGSPALLGGVNPGDREAIYRIVRTRAPRRILEVGTHVGASTLAMACALARCGDAGHLTTVDVLDVNADDGPWRRVGSRACPRTLAEDLGVGERIEFVTQPAMEALRAAARDGRRFDLVFLDGDHGAAAVYEEVAAATFVLAEGGWILLHDYYPGARPLFPDGRVIPGPYRALQRLRRETPGLSVRPFGLLPWPTKQGSHATSLALVVRA
ncbi:MAG: class I SAM-dependent methyltransferase [Deltaproteobacteria bacterium]|nr:MAG: class I SAM-dependent methyltransferase [Deltaproteobacteria bacterium]